MLWAAGCDGVGYFWRGRDIFQVGERFIINGAFIVSDVFPQMGGNASYDYMTLEFMRSPSRQRIESGSYPPAVFHRFQSGDNRLRTKTVDPNGVCGADDAADCYFGMEIHAENEIGMMIQNKSNGTGTLNGATDYAAGNGLYIDEADVSSSVPVDNASWAGMRVGNNDGNRIDINLANADAAIEKVAIPILPPTNLAGTTPADIQQVNLTWTASTESLFSFNHVIYWKKAAGSPITINPNDNTTYDGKIITDQSATSYVHSGLDGATQYNYVIRAKTSVGGVSTSEPSANSYSITTNSFVTTAITTDNDPDLLIHYDFNNHLNDSKNIYGDSRYSLMNTGGTITFVGSRFPGDQAAYFDADSGYLYNDYFNETDLPQLSEDFTISVWANPSQEKNRASIVSTGNGLSNGSFQIDNAVVHHLNGSLYSSYPRSLELNTWRHVALIKKHTDDIDEVGTLYVNGVEVGNTTYFQTFFEKPKIGVNRMSHIGWVGHIDEFKIYSRASTASEVSNLYNNDIPSAASGTSWTKALDFDGPTSSLTGDYARKANNYSGQNPLH